MDHVANPRYDEIRGTVDAIAAFSQVPAAAMTGFRAPYLQFDVQSLRDAQRANLTYECSNPVSPRIAPWPFTYDSGFPYKWYALYFFCSAKCVRCQ
jgi:peptidoglycan/xylan/chitin deacetylase (PgdA/CDA1 family)